MEELEPGFHVRWNQEYRFGLQRGLDLCIHWASQAIEPPWAWVLHDREGDHDIVRDIVTGGRIFKFLVLDDL